MKWSDLEFYNNAKMTLKPNQMLIPVTTFSATMEGARLFNEIYLFLNKQDLGEIKRTKSGGICIKADAFRGNCWDIRSSKACVEITVIHGGMWRFQFRSKMDDGKKHLYGSQAFSIFKKECIKNGINLEDYMISKEEGLAVKETIAKPLIALDRTVFPEKKLTYERAYHIDFHNSYPAGLVNTHEEFRPVIEKFYKGRKEHEEYKDVLNLSIGFMQRKDNPVWAHLSKDAIEDNVKRVKALAQELKKNHYRILSYNTDGIWYQDMYSLGAYHGEGEGEGLGEWHNDHKNCKIRYKSKGSYEYMEDGKYTAVVRGCTKLDSIKDRKDWSWGDIFKTDAVPFRYAFVKDQGIIVIEEELEEFDYE